MDTSGGTSSSASKARSPRRARTPPSSDTPMPAKHPPPHAAERARGVPARSSRRPRTDHAVPPPWMARARPPSNTNLFLPRCHPVHHLPVNKQRRKRGRPPAGNQRRRDVNTGGRLPAPIRRCSVCPLLIREAGAATISPFGLGQNALLACAAATHHIRTGHQQERKIQKEALVL